MEKHVFYLNISFNFYVFTLIYFGTKEVHLLIFLPRFTLVLFLPVILSLLLT